MLRVLHALSYSGIDMKVGDELPSSTFKQEQVNMLVSAGYVVEVPDKEVPKKEQKKAILPSKRR